MVYNAVSAKSIIAKVYRDLNIEDPSFEYDAIEWMGEALDWIGAGVQLTDKEEFIIATNHTATLPSDLEALKGVWVVQNAPLKDNWQTADFPYDLSKVEDMQKYKIERSDEQLHDGVGSAATDLQESNVYDEYDDYQTVFQRLNDIEPDANVSNYVGHNSAESYHLNGNQIKTTFDTGLLLVAYKGIPVDDEGYPLVPDDVAYKEALFWYITKKMILGGYSSRVDYSTATQMWNKRCTQARNRANFPDMDEYEKFLQSWTKMVETERFGKGSLYHDHEDGRPSENENYRVTENGAYRVTQ
jgi:hypothetical protein